MRGRDGDHRSPPRGHRLRTLTVLAVVLILAAAAAVYAGWIPQLGDDDVRRSRATPPASGPGLSLDPPAAPQSVLVAGQQAPQISTAKLRARLAPVVGSDDLGGYLGLEVAELGANPALLRSGDSRTVTPASTLKLLTTTAALDTMGPEHRFETSVVQGRRPNELVLVGGGDPLLTTRKPPDAGTDTYPVPATLQALAEKTAEALRADQVRRVRLSYDASLFAGPAVNPAWEPSYIPDSVVSPVSALWVDEGREIPEGTVRVADPAAVAADRFAAELERAGVTVDGQPAPGRARGGSPQVAAVASAPLAQIVAHVLEASDNEGAEVLLRHVALARGMPGSSAAGAKATLASLGDLGVDVSGVTMYDGSGLSRNNRLRAETLVDVLQLAADPGHPDLRPVVSTLPVAGFNGSLDDRFLGDGSDGVGMVRAKTGTLSGVHGLAGIVVTREGQQLIFAAVADRVPLPLTLDARARLDEIAATLSTCGC